MAVRAQLEVLRELGWDLNAPSPHAALEEMITVLSEKHGENLWPIANHAHTLIELSLWEADVVEFDPMVVAATSLLVSWSVHAYSSELLPEKINARTLWELCNASADDFARCEAIFADLAVHALGDSDEVKADQSS